MTLMPNLRTLTATAALILMPLTASAAVTTSGSNNFTGSLDGDVDLGVIDLADGSFVFSGITGAESGSLNFTVTDGDAPGATGTIQVLFEEGQPESIMPMRMWAGSSVAFTSVIGGLAAEFSAPLDADFAFSFTGANPGDSVQLSIAAIPVPAAGMLLLTALGGLGVVARRRKASAA